MSNGGITEHQNNTKQKFSERREQEKSRTIAGEYRRLEPDESTWPDISETLLFQQRMNIQQDRPHAGP